jgi:hypothetical protein
MITVDRQLTLVAAVLRRLFCTCAVGKSGVLETMAVERIEPE